MSSGFSGSVTELFRILSMCLHHGGRLLARWASRHPVDGRLLEKIVLFLICCLINCSFEQALI